MTNISYVNYLECPTVYFCYIRSGNLTYLLLYCIFQLSLPMGSELNAHLLNTCVVVANDLNSGFSDFIVF